MAIQRMLLLPLVAAAVFLGAGGGAVAQNAPFLPAQQSQRHAGPLRRALAGTRLTRPQRRQMHAIVAAFRRRYPRGSHPPKSARHALRRALVALLSPAQRRTMRQNLRRMRTRRQLRNFRNARPDPTASPTP